MQLPPLTQRDFSRGVIRPSSVNDSLISPNSVSHSLNVNYDTIIGSGVVRNGTKVLLTSTAPGFAPLGLGEFVTASAVTNVAVGVFKGTSNATLYFFNTAWRTSGLTALSNTSKVRFAQLGNRFFMANGVDAMKSTLGGTTWNTTNCLITHSTVGLLYSTKNRMLASGHPNHKSRVYFSSIVETDVNGVSTITWDDDDADGDWIDFNPDDGSDITGFSGTSDTVLVFKGKGMFRINAITATVDTQLIFDFGAVSQESITECQGVTYYFSGQDIRRTTGGFPEQISRLGCQDFIDAIPQANWAAVSAGTDGMNVYFSIGDVTLNSKQNTQTTYTNVVLKFSPRDQTWSLHSYSLAYRFFIQFTQTNGRLMYGAEDRGSVQALNLGFTDQFISPTNKGKAIFFELVSQDLEFGSRSHTKKVSDKFVVFGQYGGPAGIQIQADNNNPRDIPIDLNDPNAVGKDINFEGNRFLVRWYGNSTGQSPVFEGFEFPSASDEGISR